MECSPRGGGNRLAEMLRYASGVDLITNAIRAAIGEPCVDISQKNYVGEWAEIILHSKNCGKYESLWVSDEIKENVVEQDIWVKPGDFVSDFSAANEAIGTLVLRFSSKEKLNKVMQNQEKYIKVIVR